MFNQISGFLLNPLRYIIPLVILISISVGCSKDFNTSNPVSPSSSEPTNVDRQAQNGPGWGQVSTCDCENGMDPLDIHTYIDPLNPRIVGMIDAEASNQMSSLVLGMDEYSPGEIFPFSTYVSEDIHNAGCGENNPLPAVHWQVVDFGWGVVPQEAQVLFGTEPGIPSMILPPEELTVHYSVNTEFAGRLVVNYEFICRPSGLTPDTTYYYELLLPGLIGIHGDSDGDGLPDPAEISTDPQNNDSDTDGLTDCIDPCPTNADIDGDGIPDGRDADIDGDGQPDPPLICIGYGTTFNHPGISATFATPILPQAIMAGFPVDANDIDIREIEHIWLDNCVPTDLIGEVENPNNWVVRLTSQATPRGRGFTRLVPDMVIVDYDEIDVIFPTPIPDNVEVDLVCTVGSQVMQVLISVQSYPWVIPPPPCTCPWFEVNVTPWHCCDDNEIIIHFHCGTCPYSFMLDQTVVWYDKDYPDSGCIDETSSPTQNQDYNRYNLKPWIWWNTWQCPDIYITAPRSRCKQHFLDFELKCYDWAGNLTSTQIESVSTPAPDLNPPELVHWEYIDSIGPPCYTKLRFRARDECLIDWYKLEIIWWDGSRYVDWYKWHDCWDKNNTLDVNRPQDGPPVCDEGCSYHDIRPCMFCWVDCLKVTAYDTCGNWRTLTLQNDALPRPESVAFTGKPGLPGIAEGNCIDSDDPDWRQYINLKKTMPDLQGPVCPGQNILPAENDNWVIVEVQIDPPYPGVPVYWHQFDPYHRPMNFGGANHNEWNNDPDPLWDYYKSNPHPRWGGPVTINCWDPDQWDKGHDNNNWIYNPFRLACDWSYVTNFSYTDCEGKARIRFITSPYGGDNHIIIADVCGHRMKRNCADPAVSETIEVWRYAEVYFSEMQAGTPPYNICMLPIPPVWNGACELLDSWVITAFEDCFVDVTVLNNADSPAYQFQTYKDPCLVDIDWVTGTPLSNWPTAARPYYQVYLMGASYYCSADSQTGCDPSTGPHFITPEDLCPPDPPPNLAFGYACAPHHLIDDCDKTRGRVWVGLINDYYSVYPSGNISVANNPVNSNRKSTAHELGHIIGDLRIGDYIDTHPGSAQNPIDPANIRELAQYGQYARSLMFYTYDASFFNVPHVIRVRNKIDSCLY